MVSCSTHAKKIGIVLLSIFFVLQPMDLPKKGKSFSKITSIEEGNIVVHFFRNGLPDQDNSLVAACVKDSDISAMQLAISQLPKNKKLRKNIICQALYCAVKNNNSNALELLRKDKKTTGETFACLSENIASFIQLAIFFNSWNVIELLTHVYAEDMAVKELSQAGEQKQPDIFKALNQGSSVVMRKNLFEIIKANHEDILELLNNRPQDLQKYMGFIKQKNLFSPKQLQELYPASLSLDQEENDDACKPKNGSPRREKCIIS